IDAHRRGGVILIPDHDRAAGVREVYLVALGGARRLLSGLGPGLLQRGGESLVRGHRAQARARALMSTVAAAPVVLAAVAGAPEAFEEFAVGDVQRPVEIVRSRLGADHGALLVHGELDPVAELGLPGVL